MTREHCDFNPSRGRVIDCLGTSSSPSGRCGDRSPLILSIVHNPLKTKEEESDTLQTQEDLKILEWLDLTH